MEERESSMARVVGLLKGVISWQREFFLLSEQHQSKDAQTKTF